MATKLITIDSSTKKTSVAYFCNGKYRKHYLFDYEKYNDINYRLEMMAKDVWNILEKHKPDIIYIEETYLGKNAQTLKNLTRLQGVVYAWCILNNCEFNTITPASWRKLLNFQQKKGLKRPELKVQSIQYVYDTYKLEVNDDEADAICIGDAVIQMFKNLEQK